MSKARKFAVVGAYIWGLGNTFLNLLQQLNEIESTPEQKFDWRRLLFAGGKGALLGAAGGSIVGSIADYQNSLEKPINTDACSQALASKLRLKKTDRKYLLLCEKSDILISLIKKEFAY